MTRLCVVWSGRRFICKLSRRQKKLRLARRPAGLPAQQINELPVSILDQYHHLNLNLLISCMKEYLKISPKRCFVFCKNVIFGNFSAMVVC